MNLLRLVIAWLALLLATPAMADPLPRRLVQYPDFPAKAALPRNVTIWLPPGYDQSTRRYPVIYMHDGQNLFDPATSYGGKTWGVAEALVAMKRDVIVVGAWSTKLRGQEYFPQKVFALLPPAQQANVRATHGGDPLGDGYLAFLVNELKPYIDKTYRTRTGPRDTSVMGSSMGGLISLYAMAEYPKVFGQAACVSIHWPLGNPAMSDPDAVATAFKAYLMQTKLRPGKNRLYMDHGTLTLDSTYAPFVEKMEPVLAGLGWHRNRDWVSRSFPGTAHNEESWRARVDIPLAFLLVRTH
jgi:pimeloyl-ACP methyl ester carboxylesterase